MSALAMLPAAPAVPFGTRSNVPFGCGNVCAQATFAGLDRRSGRPAYAIRIANNTQHQLSAAVRFASMGAPCASDIDVAPFSIVDTLVAGTRCGDRAIVEVQGSGLKFTVDARAVMPAGRPALRAIAWISILLCLALVAAAAAFIVQARAFAHPQTRAAQPVRVVTRTRTVLKEAKPLLDELLLPNSAVVAGSVLHVRYGAHAGGTVWLLDQQGRVWAKRAISAVGETVFRVPQAAAGRTLRVVISAARGNTRAQMAASILVVPDSQNVLDTATPAPAAEVLAQRVASGEPVRIRFRMPHGEAVVSITDLSGGVIEEMDVAPTERSVQLRAPAVGAPSTYDVVVSIARGHAQEQSIQALTVLPKN